MHKLASPPTHASRPARRQSEAPAPGLSSVPANGKAAIALLQSSSLPMLVERELERMIVDGEIRAGSKLNESDIADRLGVSRGPVREAFRALEASGLVRLERNRGVFVREIGSAEADEIYELRGVLETFVGRRLARTASPAALRELRARVATMERAAEHNDVETYVIANVAFHDRLVELAGNAKLLDTYRRLLNQLRLHRHATLAQDGVLPVSSREHRAIVEAIASGRPAAAARALVDHVAASRERMHRARVQTTPSSPPRTGRSR